MNNKMNEDLYIDTILLPIKDVYKMEGCSACAKYHPDTGRHSITLAYHTSTKDRLHELAHCVLNHCMDGRESLPLQDFANAEIDAEIWAYQKCARIFSVESLINIGRTIIDYKIGVNPTFATILKSIARHNYTLTKEQRSYLWDELRFYEKESRRK